MEVVDLFFGVREDRVLVFDHAVGRKAAHRFAEGHRAAARMEAQAQLARCLDQRLKDALAPTRKHVVVVGRQRAPAQQQPRHRSAGGEADSVGVDLGPDRVQRPQPLEQTPVRHIAASRPLVHVVVRVDQAWNGDAVRQVNNVVGCRRLA